MERPYPKVIINEKAERVLRGGHPWVYGEEVTAADGCMNGEIADVFSGKGRWLGAGFYNDVSKIRVRVISKNANDRFDAAFWERRLRWSVDYRRAVMGADFSSCRLVFGEADGLPGLTVDRFGDILVTQSMCLGTDRLKPMLFPALAGIMRECGAEVSAIYERNDAALRDKEGMPRGCGFFASPGLREDPDGSTVISENGIRYDVDYVNGQKTGFFLDQKYNRAAVARLAGGRRVLDCFTHTGAFALNCAAAGAEKVVAVDASAEALSSAARNAKLNGIEDRVEFLRADVFELLTGLSEKKRGEYDLIVLDPPAFAKSGAALKSAVKGYKEINMRAMRMLSRGGFLATCSCSHFMTDELFRKMLRDAAADASVELRQVEARQQSPDHPILMNVPETDYLKFYILQIV
ncbi:MAG: class I SAM-dependent rRNA methyltransferase [Clostridia bacterium]|nr:class I SAM-dependent rRNA methyltransferase [Clostridia bacterium]